MLTPYQFGSNTPIQAIDLDGLEAKIVVNSQYNISRISKLFHPGSSDIEANVAQQAALVIAWYSTQARYSNDAHTRMYPDINFPESGLAAEGFVDNSIEGVQIWGKVVNDDGNEIEVYLGTVRNEARNSDRPWWRGTSYTPDREATELEKILYENIDQTALGELINIFMPEEGEQVVDFLRENGLELPPGLTGLPPKENVNSKFHAVPGDSGKYYDSRKKQWRIGVKLEPGGGVSPLNSRPVKNKKDSIDNDIK